MRRDNRHSNSANAVASAAWRFSAQVATSSSTPSVTQRPASEPGGAKVSRDLGSDDDWQPIDGSDSDVDINDTESDVPFEPPEQIPISYTLPPSDDDIDHNPSKTFYPSNLQHIKHQSNHHDEEVSFHWNNEDEETFIDDLPSTRNNPSIPNDSSDDALPLSTDPYYAQSPKSFVSQQSHVIASMANSSNSIHHHSITNSKIAPSTSSTSLTAQVRDEYDLDECDQLLIIPGYNGIVKKNTSTSALAELPPSRDTTTRPILWADRPRESTTGSTTPAITPATDVASTSGSPATARASRPGSDSGLSSHSQGGSSSALRLSARTSSETSDGSRKATKSVSFDTRGMDGLKATNKIANIATTLPTANPTRSSHSEENTPTHSFVNPQTAAPISPPTRGLGSNRSSGSLKLSERRVSSLRMSLRDGKARLGAGRLSSSKRHQRRAAAHERAASHEIGNDFLGALHGPPALDRRESAPVANGPANRSDKSNSNRNRDSTTSNSTDSSVLIPMGSNQTVRTSNSTGLKAPNDNRLSSKSDGGQYFRQESIPSSAQSNGERPVSTPLRPSSSTFDNSSSMISTTHSEGTNGDPYHYQGSLQMSSAPRQKVIGNTDYRPPSPSVAREKSFLECVVELLRGMTVLRRKNFMSASEVQIWLTSNMQAVKFKTYKKGHAPVVNTLNLSRVRKLHVKGSDKELSIEMIEGRKNFDFIFPSRERADVWLSGLCCLVPSYASVKARNRRLDNRDNYDPLLDSWNGKRLSSRKRLNEYVLLGSIGQGSFGKVKLALSASDRQFYAVKVLSKAMMRKRMRTVPFDRGLQEAGNPSQLTVSDVNEIVIMKHLDHDNIMKMQGVFDVTDEDRLYIVLEFLAKGPIMSSSKLFGETPLTENRARSAFVDVLAGLEYLHHNNIVHRDIKPDNLLEAGDGTVKISDFGAAMLYKGNEQSDQEELRSFSNTVGTPAFTAPELCMNDRSPACPARCFSADIWSLGATLFYLVYGQAPFIARSVFEMYDSICTVDLQFPETPAVSKSLQTLIRQLLEKEPQKRATYDKIIHSPWLTEDVEIAERLDKLRKALLTHSQENDSNY